MRLLGLAALACCACAANPLAGIFQPSNLKRAEHSGVEVTAGTRAGSLVLRFAASENPGALVVPVPPEASDWTRFAAFTFEFRSSSSIRWELQIRNRQGETFTFRVQPYENVRVKAAIPAAFLTSEYMNNRQFTGYWLSNWGNHIDLRQVESLAIRMSPDREVRLELGPLALEPEPVSEQLYLDRPVVDRFGQWMEGDWPGKVRSLSDLRQAWNSEDVALAEAPDFGFCRYGGWKERTQRATGFFRTAAVDGRWWLVDPDGHLFFSAGPDCVRFRDPTRVAGREKLFAQLPAGANDTADFYRANATLRYGEAEFLANWKAKSWQRLRAWGCNTVANWSDAALFEKPAMPFVTNVSVGRSSKNWQRFPDIYADEFVRSAEADAREQCGRFRDEAMLIGYFIGNEPRWPTRNLLDLILRDPQHSATQAFVRRYLKDHGESQAARDTLLETLSRRYFQIVSDAIRRADPHHLVLGIRWAGSAPDPVLKANDVFDVFSINIYRFEPPRDQLERIYAMLHKPVLIGEFHFGAPERGYAPSLVMVQDQTERGVAYQYYLEHAAALPFLVGAHYFQFCDQPVSGRFDGENYNIGFVSQADLPYPELISFARQAHRRMNQVHAGRLSPAARQARR